MENEYFANSLLAFKFLLDTSNTFDFFWKILDNNEEIKKFFLYLFKGLKKLETSEMNIRILKFNSEKSFGKMKIFINKNFLSKYAVKKINIYIKINKIKT